MQLEHARQLARVSRYFRENYDTVPVPEPEHEPLARELAQLHLFQGAARVRVEQAHRYTLSATVRDGATAIHAFFAATYQDAEPYQAIRVNLGVNLGRVLMRPETIGDKISEVFRKTEVDFPEHPAFSAKYYVVAEDEQQFRSGASREFLDALADVDRLVVEISGSTLIATRPRIVQIEDAVSLARLAFRLATTSHDL